MVQITLQEIENMSRKELKQAIRACFEYAPETSPVDRLAVLQEAQFYSRELERRSDSWVSWRDLLLEVVVIGLIGWEIHMGYSQQTHQDQAFEKEKAIWEHMDTSTKATADTLTSLAGTTDAMNKALQKQLALFYDVSLNVVFDQDRKKLTLANNGRTNVVLWGGKVGDTDIFVPTEGRTITAGAGFEFDGSPAYELMIARFPKPAQGGLLPYGLYIKNERGEEFVQHGYLALLWKGDVGILNVQTVSVAPEHWSNAKGVKPAAGKAPSPSR
jgi:hypothetical protein